MLTHDESTTSVFIGGLRILSVIDFTILGLLGGITPHVAVFSSPHGLTLSGVEHSLAAEKVLGDIGWYFHIFSVVLKFKPVLHVSFTF